MPVLLALLLVLVIAPAQAAGWDRYINGRYGYSIDIPPDFIGAPESDNGGGRVYTSAGRTQKLTVWAGRGNVLDDQGFAGEVARSMADDRQRGWNLGYQATTPAWASYSGSKGQRILYVRLISVCQGAQYAEFKLEYPAADIAKMNPIVDRLAPSFKSGANCS